MWQVSMTEFNIDSEQQFAAQRQSIYRLRELAIDIIDHDVKFPRWMHYNTMRAVSALGESDFENVSFFVDQAKNWGNSSAENAVPIEKLVPIQELLSKIDSALRLRKF